MTELVTYLGKPDLKTAFLCEIGKHEALDAITKGTYGAMNGHFKGCAIGCSVYSLNILQGKKGKAAALKTGDHGRIVTDLGWPLWLAYAEDTIFENLPIDLAKTWPRRLAEAVPVGVTIPDVVLAKVLRWMLIGDRFGVVHAADAESVKTVVRRMGALFDRTIAWELVPDAEWEEAVRAARAAWDARDARDAWAARAAWVARAARAARAARDAWDPWAAGDAWAARAAWAAWAARDARDAWAARAARAARDARDAWDPWAARAAWAAWDARDAWDAWDPWAAETRDAFYPALSEELLRLLRELAPEAQAAVA